MGGLAQARVPSEVALWEKLHSRIVTSVRDYNFEAGETIWFVRVASDSCGLVVSGQDDDSPRVCLSLDQEKRLLVCTFDQPAPEERWEFTILADCATLVRHSAPHRLEDAARDILDYLVRGGMPDAV